LSQPSPSEPTRSLPTPARASDASSARRWPAWAVTLGRHWWHLQGLKVVGICAFMALFFQAYFHVLKNPAYPVTAMPLTVVDGWIPFTPAAFWAYVSLWVYVGIAPALQPSMRALLSYGAWITALCAAGLLCFHFWPTAVPSQAHQLDPAVANHPGFALMRGIDAAGNACPSLHVGTAMFTALWLHRMLGDAGAPLALRAVNALWFVLIAWSTVAVRQHVVLDVVAGAALGVAFAVLSLRFSPWQRRAPTGQPVSSGRH
jgi:membrane-associated phospholipid phosphatase